MWTLMVLPRLTLRSGLFCNHEGDAPPLLNRSNSSPLISLPDAVGVSSQTLTGW